MVATPVRVGLNLVSAHSTKVSQIPVSSLSLSDSSFSGSSPSTSSLYVARFSLFIVGVFIMLAFGIADLMRIKISNEENMPCCLAGCPHIREQPLLPMASVSAACAAYFRDCNYSYTPARWTCHEARFVARGAGDVSKFIAISAVYGYESSTRTEYTRLWISIAGSQTNRAGKTAGSIAKTAGFIVNAIPA